MKSYRLIEGGVLDLAIVIVGDAIILPARWTAQDALNHEVDINNLLGYMNDLAVTVGGARLVST